MSVDEQLKRIQKLETRYPVGDRDALGELWTIYELTKRCFTKYAQNLIQSKDTAQAEDLVGDLSFELSKEDKAATYDSTKSRWATWAKTVELNLYLMQQRKSLLVCSYHVTEASLRELRVRLQRKANKSDAIFPAGSIEPVVEALRTLIGMTFIGAPGRVEGSWKLPSSQISRELRTRILETHIVDDKQFAIVAHVVKLITAVRLQEQWPVAEVDANGPKSVEFEDSAADPNERADRKEIQETVERRVKRWLDVEFVRNSKSAACYFLHHYHDGFYGNSFLSIRLELEACYPRLKEMLLEIDEGSEPTPEPIEEPCNSKPLRSKNRRPITWEETSACVFNSPEAHAAKKYYRRVSKPSFEQWQLMFESAPPLNG